jgi:hypothetical protein
MDIPQRDIHEVFYILVACLFNTAPDADLVTLAALM